MPDDLDQLLRAAMKTLDEQVPSGYFEALPNQTLARLEGSSMQHGSSGTTTDARDAVAPPPLTTKSDPAPAPAARPIMDQDREEDSGLHDIRNLAQSTKQRLSSRRSITNQPVSDDVLASSSGAFKNIALPQPAAMVSLPAVDELPSKAEVAAAEKAAKEAAKKAAKEAAKEAKESGRSSKSSIAPVAPAAAPIETPVVAAVPARQAFSLPSQQRKSSKGPLIGILGLGLAAAAGAVIYMQVQKNQDAAPAASSADQAVAKQDVAATAPAGSAAAAPVVTAIPEPAPPPAPVEPPKEEAPAAGAAQLATDNVKDAEEKADKKKTPAKTSKGGKSKVEKEEPKEEVKPVEKTEPKKPVATTKAEGGEGEPSFDALLKEAGVDGQKKEVKPKLDKKSLSGDDFKKGMSSPANKAKGCYKGTQGTAMVKLTVAPSGSISKLTVSGDFAGKPEASCVESALKGASFPPWDGGPQTFTYSVLLSD
jgi:hypothetical protein